MSTVKTKTLREDEIDRLRKSASLMYQMLKRIADEKEVWTVPMVKKVLRTCTEFNSFFI